MGRRKKIAFILVLLGLLYLCLEVFSFAVIRMSATRLSEPIRSKKEIYREQTERIKAFLEPGHREMFDPVLGWKYRPEFSQGGDIINSQGLRSKREYTDKAQSRVIRVAAFGDSFTYCNEVDNDSSWPMQIERQFTDIEVLNYGVGGYGTDQAYLRYKQEGLQLNPDVVLIGFAPTDLRRTVNVYRRFYSALEIPLFKPRFILDPDGNLKLVPNPLSGTADYEQIIKNPSVVRKYGLHDQWYEPVIYNNPLYDISLTVRLLSVAWVRVENKYWDPDRTHIGGVFNENCEAFKLQMALFKKFYQQVRDAGKVPIIVMFPGKFSIIDASRGERKMYDPLVDAVEAAGLAYIDLYDAFAEQDIRDSLESWFMGGGHYSPEGNRIIAEYLGEKILEIREPPMKEK